MEIWCLQNKSECACMGGRGRKPLMINIRAVGNQINKMLSRKSLDGCCSTVQSLCCIMSILWSWASATADQCTSSSCHWICWQFQICNLPALNWSLGMYNLQTCMYGSWNASFVEMTCASWGALWPTSCPWLLELSEISACCTLGHRRRSQHWKLM